ncbi:MAG: DUF2130 domain-containing protein [Pseudomonadota bacterium]
MADVRPFTPTHGHTEASCPTCEQPIPRELSEAITARIAEREREDQRRLQAEIARARADIEAQSRAEMAAKVAELDAARRAAEAQVAEMQRTQEALIATRIAEAREGAERAAVAAVQAEQAKAFDDKQKLQAKIAELQRQLESKTAQELGDGAEVDLFEVLRAEFPEDRISRVAKGLAGADIVHEVLHNGRFCGRIVYDAKNRSAWRNDYVTKLRQDQAEHKADHAVLASKVFPAGARELHLQEGVLVVSPQRVVVVAHLLRRHVVQGHALRQGNEARAAKTEALYAFILSERCAHLLGSIDAGTDHLVDLDAREQKAHQATWKRRAELIRAVQKAHGDLTFEIDRIIGTAGNRAGPDEGE